MAVFSYLQLFSQTIFSVLFFLGIVSSILDLYNRFTTKVFFKDFYEIQKSSSISRFRFENNNYPNLLEVIFDIRYAIQNLSKKPLIFFIRIVLTYLIFQIFQIIPITFTLIYLFSFILIGFIIFLSILLKKNTQISLDNFFPECINTIGIIKILMLSPIKLSFITWYIILNTRTIGKIPEFNPVLVISIILLQKPLWFVSICAWLAVEISEAGEKAFYTKKSILGKTSVLHFNMKNALFKLVIRSLRNSFLLIHGRKIIITAGTISLNGGSDVLIKETCLKALKFDQSRIAKLNGIYHQVFKESKLSNRYIILTSSESFETSDGTYKCIKGLGGQFYAFSYLDEETIDFLDTSSYSVMGARSLYSLSNFMGHWVKLNVLYNHYETHQVLYQSKTEKRMFTLLQPTSLSAAYCAVNTSNVSEIEGCARLGMQSYTPHPYNYTIDDVMDMSFDEIFKTIKKDTAFYEDFLNIAKFKMIELTK